MKKACHLLLFLFFSLNTFSQYKYWVSFRDKKNVSFDPYSYFDKRTIEQRKQQNSPEKPLGH